MLADYGKGGLNPGELACSARRGTTPFRLDLGPEGLPMAPLLRREFLEAALGLAMLPMLRDRASAGARDGAIKP